MGETAASLTPEPSPKPAETDHRFTSATPIVRIGDVEHGGVITWVNPKALVEYGVSWESPEVLIGQKVDLVLNDKTVTGDARKTHLLSILKASFKAAMSLKKHKPDSEIHLPEINVITASGKKKSVRLKPQTIRDAKGRFSEFEIEMEDITQAKRDQALRKSSEILSSNHSLDIILNQMRQSLSSIVDHETANIMLFTESEDKLLNMSWGYNDNNEPVDREPSIVNINEAEPLREVVKTGTKLVIPSTSKHKGWRDTTREGEPPIKSYIGVPIRAGDELIGILSVNSSHDGFFNEEDGDNLQSFANQLGQAVNTSTLLEDLNRLATTDPLTGLFNRRVFFERLDDQLNRARRSGRALSLLMMDLDLFKIFNDKNGHLAGDERLKQVAGILREQVRQTDVAARYGGEEFVIILPDTDTNGATILALRILEAMREKFPKITSGVEINPGGSLSIGIATYPTQEFMTEVELLNMADEALYIAKNNGRNQVCLASTRERLTIGDDGLARTLT